MISAIISAYLVDNHKEDIVKRCVKSLKGADEVIVLATVDNIGFCRAWNLAASLAKGDYLIFIGDNNYLSKGSLKELAVENTVTSPLLNGIQSPNDFWGFVFCLPRNIYEAYGLYDMAYNDGIHNMDTDLMNRLKEKGVNMETVFSVDFYHPEGGRTLGLDPNFTEKVEKNNKIFRERWDK